MWQARGGRLWWGIGVLIAAVWACETARNPGGIQPDLISPTIALSASQDTQLIASGLSFAVNATDNLGLKDIRLTYTGGYFAVTDTIFNTTVTSINLGQTVTFPPTSGAGGFITIVGRATDGAGNYAEDTIVIFLDNVQALKVFLLAPVTGALASQGKGIPVSVQAQQIGGIQRIGFIVTPRSAVVDSTPLPINSKDSVVFTTRFPPDTTYTDTLIVLASTGTFDVTAFAVDAGGRPGFSSPPVTVTVQSAANDLTPPVVSHSIAARVEVNDSITVHATDPSGISWIGFRVDTALTAVPPFTGVVPLKFDSVNVAAGSLTDVVRVMSLGLAALISQFPKSVVIRGYACDLATARNCAFSQTSTVITAAAPRAPLFAVTSSSGVDTVVIVAGLTKPLPFGGTIVDAIFNKNQNELYLTNPALGRVEIFRVAGDSFVKAGIPTAASVPWGIALWPHDTLGNYGDSIVVADAGGTQLSIVDVTPSARLLRWRQDLPDFLIQTYKVVEAPGFKTQITEYNVSDRPQYVATVCRTGSAPPNCDQDSIFALYSTTPEPSNPSPFTGRGTLRMEKLHRPAFTGDATALFGHLFWELAAAAPSATSDTLRIVLRRPRPYNQSLLVLSACAGVTVELSSFALGDTTFARNSGNFTHGFFGEGGRISAAFARVMSYTTKAELRSRPDPAPCLTGGPITDSGRVDVDFGMSPGVEVRDFISNTATTVRSIATNFNGLTNVARADSLYYLDEGLRLKATSPDSGIATGMDMNYNHSFAPGGSCGPPCGGTGSINDRIIFAARFDGNIDVFDTYFGVQIATIPIRDPIIGPLRVAQDASGNQLLFGITARGLVMVQLPAFTNPLPEAPPRR